MKTHPLKRAIQLLGILILLHAIAMLFFGLFLSNTVAYMSEDHPIRASLTVLIFNVIVDLAVIAVFSNFKISDLEYKKSLKEELKQGNFSLIKHWKEDHLRDTIISIIIFIIIQIPFAIFYSLWGFSLQYTTIFEQFYIIDAGSYLLTNSAIFGILLNTVLFGAIYFAVNIFLISITKKNVKDEIIV